MDVQHTPNMFKLLIAVILTVTINLNYHKTTIKRQRH